MPPRLDFNVNLRLPPGATALRRASEFRRIREVSPVVKTNPDARMIAAAWQQAARQTAVNEVKWTHRKKQRCACFSGAMES
jgi:hypothetical protein